MRALPGPLNHDVFPLADVTSALKGRYTAPAPWRTPSERIGRFVRPPCVAHGRLRPEPTLTGRRRAAGLPLTAVLLGGCATPCPGPLAAANAPGPDLVRSTGTRTAA